MFQKSKKIQKYPTYKKNPFFVIHKKPQNQKISKIVKKKKKSKVSKNNFCSKKSEIFGEKIISAKKERKILFFSQYEEYAIEPELSSPAQSREKKSGKISKNHFFSPKKI